MHFRDTQYLYFKMFIIVRIRPLFANPVTYAYTAIDHDMICKHCLCLAMGATVTHMFDNKEQLDQLHFVKGK